MKKVVLTFLCLNFSLFADNSLMGKSFLEYERPSIYELVRSHVGNMHFQSESQVSVNFIIESGRLDFSKNEICNYEIDEQYLTREQERAVLITCKSGKSIYILRKDKYGIEILVNAFLQTIYSMPDSPRKRPLDMALNPDGSFSPCDYSLNF